MNCAQLIVHYTHTVNVQLYLYCIIQEELTAACYRWSTVYTKSRGFFTTTVSFVQTHFVGGIFATYENVILS